MQPILSITYADVESVGMEFETSKNQTPSHPMLRNAVAMPK